MEKIINSQNLRSFAYTNEGLIKGKIKGVVLDFFGLGGMAMFKEDTGTGIFYAERDVLFVLPYSNPWGWMNKDEVALTDEILDVLFEKYGLDDSTPVISTGGSMGGLACIVYTKYAKRTPVGCVANCPVCDLVYHFTEREDLPRTIYSAFFHYDCTFEEALKSASPLHLAPSLPKETKYVIFHCEKDEAVNIDKHSVRFVDELSKTRDIEFIRVPDKGHCDLGEENVKRYREFALSFIFNK